MSTELIEMSKEREYIFKVIRYFRFRGLDFFISSLNFHIISEFYARRIPISIVYESIDAVIDRCRRKAIKIWSYIPFKYEVEKRFQSFQSLTVGRPSNEPEPEAYQDLIDLEHFLDNFPPELQEAKSLFESAVWEHITGGRADLQNFHRKIIDITRGREDLETQVQIFLNGLDISFRTPEIETRYRVNLIFSRYKIPELDILA